MLIPAVGCRALYICRDMDDGFLAVNLVLVDIGYLRDEVTWD
jgi:hypothetical protein